MQNAKGKELFIGAVALLITGCAPFGPHYHRAPVESASAFKEQVSTGSANGSWSAATPRDTFPKGNWWEVFSDPKLNELEQRVLVANQSVRQSEAQFRAAMATVSANRAAYFPAITTNPSATRGYGPNGGARSSSRLNTYNDFTLPLTASWEPDLWGQITLSVRNAKASAQATAAQLSGIRLSLQAQLAADYFVLQATDMELALLNMAITSYDEALRLTQIRYNGGVASQADVAQAQTQLDSTRAQATDLALTRAQYEHAMAVLVGQSPSSFSLPSTQIQSPLPPVPLLIPAQILERRPDVASAERLMAAANANVGIARTAYFPAISLSATGGFESGSFVDWLSWPNRFWSIGASAVETLFDFGRRFAQYKAVQAQYDASVAGYRQTVLTAFQDVEDSLSALRLFETEAAQQAAAIRGAEQSLQLEQNRYKAGIVSYLDVITTQNIWLTNERTGVELQGRRMAAAVSLIRSIGGGWNNGELPWPEDVPRAEVVTSSAPLGISNPPVPMSASMAPAAPNTPTAVVISPNNTTQAPTLPNSSPATTASGASSAPSGGPSCQPVAAPNPPPHP